MSNVVQLRISQYTPDAASSRSSMSRDAEAVPARTSAEIRHCILTLDLAAQQARLLTRRLRDPAAKNAFDARLSTIERMIQFSRDMTVMR